MDLQEIRANLQYGDRRLIAKVAKCDPKLVTKVLKGEVSLIQGKAPRILRVAKEIILKRNILRARGCKW